MKGLAFGEADFHFFSYFLFDVHFSLWTFGGSTGNFFFVFADPFELFSGSLILSSPGCFTLKSWVFRVHSNYVFRSPEKLKISVFSIQVHWVFRSPEKNSRICSPEKNSLSHRQMSIRKSLHQKKKMENSSPEGSSLHTHHEKLFITQKETRTDHYYPAGRNNL